MEPAPLPPFSPLNIMRYFSKTCPSCRTVLILLAIEGGPQQLGIATRYGLDGTGIESRWGRDFPRPSRPALRPAQPPIQWVPGLSRG